MIACMECAGLKAELAAHKAFMSQWYDIFSAQVRMVQTQSAELRKETAQFRHEILAKFVGLETLVLRPREQEFTPVVSRPRIPSQTNASTKSYEDNFHGSNRSEILPGIAVSNDENDDETEENFRNFTSPNLTENNSAEKVSPSSFSTSKNVETETFREKREEENCRANIEQREQQSTGSNGRENENALDRVRMDVEKGGVATTSSSIVKQEVLDNEEDSQMTNATESTFSNPIGPKVDSNLEAALLAQQAEFRESLMYSQQGGSNEFASIPSAGVGTEIFNESTPFSAADLTKMLFRQKRPFQSGIRRPRLPDDQQQFENVPCNICDKTISLRSSIASVHAATHLGVKPFQCVYCEVTAIQKNNVTRHMRMVHSDLPEIEPRWLMDREQYRMLLRQKHKECFGNRTVGAAKFCVNAGLRPQGGFRSNPRGKPGAPGSSRAPGSFGGPLTADGAVGVPAPGTNALSVTPVGPDGLSINSVSAPENLRVPVSDAVPAELNFGSQLIQSRFPVTVGTVPLPSTVSGVIPSVRDGV